MANNALTRLYRIMVQDPTGDPTVQRRILAVGAASNDGDLLATLENLPVLAPDVDSAIGKRKGAKERAAWIARKERTSSEVRAALKSEKRVVVLQAAAKRTDLTHSDYALLANHDVPKVWSALLLNSEVSIEIKKSLATRWGARMDDDGWRASDALVRHFGPIPATHDALASQSTNEVVLTFVSKSALSEASQMRVLKYAIVSNLARVKAAPAGTNYYEISRRFEEALNAAKGLASSAGTTPEVREQLLQAFVGVGVIPGPNRSYYSNANLEQSRIEMIEAIKAGPTGAILDPAEEAANTLDLDRLLVLAQLAKSDSNATLAQAVIANPIATGEILREVCGFIGWHGRNQVLEMLARREDPSAFIEVLLNTWGAIDDDILAKTNDPSAVLCRIAAKTAETVGTRGSADALMVLQSRWCTPEVLVEMPVASIGHPEAPANIAKVVNTTLVKAFGADEQKWTLFEALVGDGSLPLREVIEAVHALAA